MLIQSLSTTLHGQTYIFCLMCFHATMTEYEHTIAEKKKKEE